MNHIIFSPKHSLQNFVSVFLNISFSWSNLVLFMVECHSQTSLVIYTDPCSSQFGSMEGIIPVCLGNMASLERSVYRYFSFFQCLCHFLNSLGAVVFFCRHSKYMDNIILINRLFVVNDSYLQSSMSPQTLFFVKSSLHSGSQKLALKGAIDFFKVIIKRSATCLAYI